MMDKTILKSDSTNRLFQKIGDYWNDLSKTSSREIDSQKFWEPYDCAQIMMTHAYELLQLCSNNQSVPILEESIISILDDSENRYLRIKWGEVNVSIIFDILESESLNKLKNIHNFLPETDIFIVLLPFPPKANECRIASDLRDEGISILLMCPIDFNALISARWNILDLLTYKIFRVFLLGKQDIEGVYEKYTWLQFKTTLQTTETRPPELDLDEALKKFDIKITELLEHPVFKDLQKSLQRNNFVLISGPSSSGKTYLALRTAHNVYINLEKDIWYFDIGSARAEDAIHLGIRLLDRGIKAKELLLVLDDLQTNPDMARQMILFLSLFQHLIFGNKLQILGVSWPDFKPEIEAIEANFITFDINASQLSGLMIDRFRKRLSEQQIKTIEKTVGDDLLLLNLSLKISNELARYLTPKELAEELWKRKTASCNIPLKVMERSLLVASIIGQYECEVTKTFLMRQAQINESEIGELAKGKLIRYHRGQINAGHRSFCTLMSEYLGGKEKYWKWFKTHDRPSTPEDIVVEFILSLPPAQVWPILKSIHTHVGFKTNGYILREGFPLSDYWQNLDYLLERIINQQKDDPTWGRVPSSATFSIEAFSAMGMRDEAKGSINFLRDSYWTDNEGLFVKTDKLATSEDFKQIKKRMKSEDLEKKKEHIKIPFESADKINENLLHENWARGLILCAEASYGEKSESELMKLAKLVEKSSCEGGYFYPARVPWCTARVLMGLGSCGRTIHNSKVVAKAAKWLLNSRDNGGAFHNGVWEGGTGGWNSLIETTAMCIIASVAVGVDKNDKGLMQAMNNLIAEKRKWTEQDSELDGVIAIEAYSMLNHDWEEILKELQVLSNWAKTQALWLYATSHSDETFAQSCRIAQVAATLIRLTWKRMSSDLPNLLKAFALSKTNAELSESLGELKTPIGCEEPSKSVSSEVDIDPDKITRIIKKVSSIDLSEFYAVGGYTKFDEVERNNLKDLFVKISEAILEKSDKRENYLIWAPPGSGKTYLIDRIAEVLKNRAKYRVLNLSKMERKEFLSELHDIQKDTDSKGVICLIDEVDSKKEESWPFEILLSFFDSNKHTTHSLIWILAGSSEENITIFKNSLKQRVKGKDLISRIPQENIIEIPLPSLEDRLLLILSYIKRLSDYRQSPIKHIEKFALFYLIMSSELSNPRQLEDFIHAGIKRVSSTEDRLRYDDIFRSGDLKNKEFWKKYEITATQFIDRYISIT